MLYPSGKASVQVQPLELPLYGHRISAGFPSPADDWIESRLDINQHLVLHPAATFYVRVSGDSMINAGIMDGDYLVVDRALTPQNNSIVVAVVAGELTVKRLYQQWNRVELRAENPAYPPLSIHQGDLHIWGVVVGVFRKL